MQNTYLYIRYSTEAQSQGSSYARQLGMAKDYCPTLIEDAEHIYFDSGKSAFSGANLADGGELKRFYDAVAHGTIPKGSTLLVEDLDRLSRAGMWKASDKLRELTENGIAVVTLRDKNRYEGVLKISDGLMSLIKQDLANEESIKKSGRVAGSYVARYAKAREGIKVKVLLPSWLEWTSATTEYRVKEAEASTVKEIFAMAAAGHSYAYIAKELNTRGVKPFRRKRNEDRLWITASIFALVKSRAVLGEYAPNDGGEAIPLYFPPIVDIAVFNLAQGARAERKHDGVTHTSDRVNVWGKVGVCGLCKRPMHCLPKGRGNQLYLVCSGKAGGVCKGKNVREDRAELAFREILLNAVHADYFAEDSRKVAQGIRQLVGQIDAVRGRKGRLVDMLENDPMPEIIVAIKKVNTELQTLEEAKAALEETTARDMSIESSRAAMMGKIDLQGKEARMEANSLLRRLKTRVEILKSEDRVAYAVRQDNKSILFVYDNEGMVSTTAISQEVAERMFERGETTELEYSVPTEEIS